MGYSYNPLTGNLDRIGLGGGGGVVTNITTDAFTTTLNGAITQTPGLIEPQTYDISILGSDTVVNNDNGIQTLANPNNQDLLNIQLTNRVTSIVTTNNAVGTLILTFNMGTTPGVYNFWGNIQGFCASVPAGTSYDFNACFRTTGVAAVEIGGDTSNQFEETALSASDISLSANGNSVEFKVFGVGVLSINWNILMEYRRVI